MRAVVDQRLAHGPAGPDHQIKDALQPVPVEHAVADLLHRDRGERRLRRRPPQHAIAAHRRDHRVPRPHRYRKIEGADHAHDPQRVPLFVHAVAGPLAVHGEAVELAREPHREIGDIDHLLHFAQAFGEDLAHFERHQRAQVRLVRAQLIADLAHDLAALAAPASSAIRGKASRARATTHS